ncbi:non-ribosomal peptide synthetase [Laspinema olomoucense]|uniref:Amino acid adenylation domain-containing protein n=1 Tax=Laspinema olomoucense D3b TaxID=2953688 RepID=A0ABT2N8L0_9CYAN|nr:non-ribosomal peptide synthetase [Laspinema sp. D3b]MCT7979016.1 amino acid adenylation domain-containing protein [Laspinema sp. D3b]
MTQETEVFVFPASFAQQRLWFLNQLAPNNPFYNVSAAIHLTGYLNLSALEESFNEIVRRHEILRTTFTLLEGQVVQVISPELTLAIQAIALQHLPPVEQDREAQRLATLAAEEPFNLTTGPLLRISVLQRSEIDSILLLNFHHIVADGWSIGILLEELGTLYTAFAYHQPSPLQPLPLQYADFTEWQQQWLQGEFLETQLSYWQQQLQHLSPLNLPSDRPRPPIPSYRGGKQKFALPPTLTASIKRLSQQTETTLFMTLLAAFKTLLYRYTGQTDIAVGSPIANRNRQEIEGLIGFFVNSLVLRTDLSENPTFLELLTQVKSVAFAAYTHQDLPFEKLVEKLHPQRDLSQNPLFQVSFSLQNTPINALELPGLTLSLLDWDMGTAKLDLEFNLWEEADQIQGQVIYSTDLFESETITRWMGHFQTLLSAIVTDPKQKISDLQILTTLERDCLLSQFNSPAYPSLPQPPLQHPSFLHLFEEIVQRSPNQIALVSGKNSLTYQDLHHQSNQLARYLQERGVKPEVLVGVCLPPSLEAVASILGILKAGGVYLYCDPSYPLERLQFILSDAEVSLLLTRSPFVPSLTPPRVSILDLEQHQRAIAQQSPESLTYPITPNHLAYVIYTSGSTGKPKGVLIEHRGLSNLIIAQHQIFKLNKQSRILQFSSLSFDASIFEIVMAFSTGATLYLADEESRYGGTALMTFLSQFAITHASLTPAVLATLPPGKLPALHTLISAGESCSPALAKSWVNSCHFFNAYGPTESTVWATVAEIIDPTPNPPIGRPIPNTQIYLLDANLQPVPIGIPGEIYIAGEGVARGYHNRKQLNSERFITHSFPPQQTVRLYKTGDLARYQIDGKLEFLGRIDHQVKIRGYRIELGEIETTITQYPNIQQARVMATDRDQLVAYIVPQGNQPINHSSLRSFLSKTLPGYMIPQELIVLNSLPLTDRGKLDRTQLPAGETLTPGQFIPPGNPSEAALAQIWATLLKCDRIGMNDNFFDLGGDSLLAVRLLTHINQQFQQQLPVSALFLNPTLKGLADCLFSELDTLPCSPLVPIQTQGTNPPFFCIHPILGVVFPYYELALHLGKNQPFYALQPQGIDGKSPPLTRIEDMAAYYIKAMQTIQPEGPYFLGGWSFGGLVAFEMAHQLKKAGHAVGLLAVLDTLAPLSTNQPSLWQGGKFLLTTAASSIWPFLRDYVYLMTQGKQREKAALHPQGDRHPQRVHPLFQFLHRYLAKTTLAQSLHSTSDRRILREVALRPLLPIFQANSQAVLQYQPSIYPDRMTLITSSDRAIATGEDPTLGWGQLTPEPIELIRIPGNHLTMLRKPQVQHLADRLRECLESR